MSSTVVARPAEVREGVVIPPLVFSYCQESGHFWRNCPKRLADEEAEASGEDKSEDQAAKGKKK